MQLRRHCGRHVTSIRKVRGAVLFLSQAVREICDFVEASHGHSDHDTMAGPNSRITRGATLQPTLTVEMLHATGREVQRAFLRYRKMQAVAQIAPPPKLRIFDFFDVSNQAASRDF